MLPYARVAVQGCFARRRHIVQDIAVLLLERRYHGHHRFDKARPFGLCVLELPLRQCSLHLPHHLIQLCLALEAVVIRSLPAVRAARGLLWPHVLRWLRR